MNKLQFLQVSKAGFVRFVPWNQVVYLHRPHESDRTYVYYYGRGEDSYSVAGEYGRRLWRFFHARAAREAAIKCVIPGIIRTRSRAQLFGSHSLAARSRGKAQ